MGTNLPSRRSSSSRTNRRTASRSKPAIAPSRVLLLLSGLLLIAAVGGGIWWFRQGGLEAALAPPDVVHALPDGQSLAVSGKSLLAGLSPDEFRGSHGTEQVARFSAQTYRNPLQRRSVDPWIELSNLRFVGIGGDWPVLQFDFVVKEGDPRQAKLTLMIAEQDWGLVRPLIGTPLTGDIAQGKRSIADIHQNPGSHPDLISQIANGARRGTARYDARMMTAHDQFAASFPPGTTGRPVAAQRKWEVYVVATHSDYARSLSFETSGGGGGSISDYSVDFKVSTSATLNGAEVTAPREWLDEEVELMAGPPNAARPAIAVVLPAEPSNRPEAPPIRMATAAQPAAPQPAAPPAVGSTATGFASVFSDVRPIKDLDGWQTSSLSDGRLKVLAPSAVESRTTERVDFGGYEADVLGAKYKDERGLFMYVSWAAFPRGVPALVRAAAGQGDFERFIALQAVAMFGRNPFSLSTLSDVRGEVHKFPSRQIVIRARPYSSSGERVGLEIVWVLGRDFAATISFAYLEPRPGVLDQVLESVEIEGQEIHELDREQFKVADRRGLDVLAEIDSAQHAIFGPWTQDGAAIVGGSESEAALLYLPARSPGSYRLTVDVERLAGDGPLHLGVWMGDQPATVVIDETPGAAVGLALVEEKALLQPLPRPTLVNRNVTIRVVVKDDTLTATADGRKLFQWQKGSSNLSLDPQLWNLPDYLLFLGTQRAKFRFRRIELEALE